jgi:hypothetical protein
MILQWAENAIMAYNEEAGEVKPLPFGSLPLA